MEEAPKDHDFDQRKDGPFEEPTVPLATETPTRERVDNGQVPKMRKSTSSPDAVKWPSGESPIGGPARHSMQMSGLEQGLPRKSTQMSGGGSRPSRDFDRRTDGPFGRPSLATTRRRSSNLTLPTSPTGAATGGSVGEAQEGQQPVSMETFQPTDAAFEPEPPPLNYTLWTRKLSIAIFWSLVLVDSIAMPIALYFGLWYATDLSPNTVFSIVTAALGGVSILEYFLRFWRLWKKGSTCRVIGARRMYLDWFHWNFTGAWIIVMIELIVGSVPDHPPIRLLSMPLATMLFAFGTELLIVDTLRYFEIPAPIRVSSIPKGTQLRPGIYSIIEDIIAVDGSGGTEFRENLNRRYEASHVFRAMLRRLDMYWAFGAEIMAVVTTILIFTLGEDAAYVVGWSVPFIWAGIWTWGTIIYVRRKLAEEKKAWAEEVSTKSNA